MGQKNTSHFFLFFFFLIPTFLMSESFMAHFCFCFGGFSVCLHGKVCGRPAAFMWLCKPRTIEDHVLCHATIAL